MVYSRFVESGRVALVNTGKYQGKLVVIADIVDLVRGVVENPVHGVARQVMRFKDLSLTDIKISIPIGARSGTVKKQYLASDVDGLWAKSNWAAKLLKQVEKSKMSDFDRFKNKIQKQQTNRKIKALVKTMKKK